MWQQACTDRLIPSLSLKAYPLETIKEFENKPSRFILSKWVISEARSPREVTHIEEVVPFLDLTSQDNQAWQTDHFPFIFIDYATVLFPFSLLLSSCLYCIYIAALLLPLFHSVFLVFWLTVGIFPFVVVILHLSAITLL